ncbi:MAG: twin transmembrane helix small protein [Burkholderiales bacterium]|nr:twin transmembrane helix small protein [Burkholderiales bacterium]OUT76005.1 MAG: twin transmembrane helix small protein [Betaproteobacteria bacterium TMED22]|tara:strand:- start:47 stop:244 length:198 start_codon:yes stop_codon:yes gene_type:complete
MKIIVILFLVAIFGSLASALVYMVRNQGNSDGTIKALTIRIGLSVILFVLLMAGSYFGIIPPSGL